MRARSGTMEAVKRSDFDLMLGKYLIPCAPNVPEVLLRTQVPDTWNVTLICTPKVPEVLLHRQVPGYTWLVTTVLTSRLRRHPCSARRPPRSHRPTSGYQRGSNRSSKGQKGTESWSVQVLQRLADMPEVFVSVITGRCLPDIKAKV